MNSSDEAIFLRYGSVIINHNNISGCSKGIVLDSIPFIIPYYESFVRNSVDNNVLSNLKTGIQITNSPTFYLDIKNNLFKSIDEFGLYLSNGSTSSKILSNYFENVKGICINLISSKADIKNSNFVNSINGDLYVEMELCS